MPKVASNSQKKGRSKEGSPVGPCKRVRPCEHLFSDFRPPELREKRFLGKSPAPGAWLQQPRKPVELVVLFHTVLKWGHNSCHLVDSEVIVL